eukprot:12018743-Heterocapsa_arctica.AAC.1
MGVDCAKDSPFLPCPRCPVVKWGRDVEVLVMFAGIEDYQVGESIGPFTFDLVEVPIVLDSLSVEN